MPSDVFDELSAKTGFSGHPLDRLDACREDAALVGGLLASPAARCLVIVRDMVVLLPHADACQPWFTRAEAEQMGDVRETVLLGQHENAPRFAVLLDDEAAVEDQRPDPGVLIERRPLVLAQRDDLVITDLRSIAVKRLAGRTDIAMLGAAKSLLHWHNRHRFCANCGAPTTSANSGWRRDCAACHAQHFPRTDPVVIMLVTDGDNCLLGRQARFGKGMYSALAGFVEPGETIENAVRREVFEEAGIRVGPVTYLASQPWPFPSSLMIGCLARALSRDIVIDRQELEDARWFSRSEVAAMLQHEHPGGLNAPQPIAIAHHLLRHWTAAS